MEKTMDIPQVWNSALATVAVAAVIIAAWLYLREYRKTEKGRAVMFTVAQLVRAAEQQFKAQGIDGPERRAWVLERAKEYFPNLNTQFLIDLIEAAVYDLNQEQVISLSAEIEDVEPARVGWGDNATEAVAPLKSTAFSHITVEDLHTGDLTTEVQVGRLDGVIDPDLGPLSGYGLYAKGAGALHSVVVCLDKSVVTRTWHLADAEDSEDV